MTPQSIAALVLVLSAVGGCTDHEKANAERVFQALGASPVDLDLADQEVGNDVAPIVQEPAPAAIPEPPVHILQPYEYGYTGPEPCTASVFGVLTCEEGQWHWLDGSFHWVT